ncbi:MAG: 2-hydroxyacid dehydrogenase [Flavobacteriaceae bacterium]
MKILHLDTNHPLLLEQLKEAGFQNDEDYTSSKEEIEKLIDKYDGVVIRSRFKIDQPFLDAAKNLKFIARVGAGLDSIDIPYAKKKKVKLIAAPEGNRNAVGEHTLGMLLSLFNNLKRADREVKSGLWNRESNRGVELDGKTVGIVGYGNMGKAFAKKLKGFNCTVLCYDIKEDVGNKNATQVSLQTLFDLADVLSLHTPWTPKTDKMVNAEFISKFKKPFWFLNTARGKSVVTEDLVSALKSKKIVGAGLDVLEYEKGSFESLFTAEIPEALKELIQMDNVILSPHIAGWTVESNEKLAQTIVEKILDKFKKKKYKK